MHCTGLFDGDGPPGDWTILPDKRGKDVDLKTAVFKVCYNGDRLEDGSQSFFLISPFGKAVNIKSCNPYYMPSVFTILFPRGTTGWHPKIHLRAGEELRMFKAGEAIVGESTFSPEVSPDLRRPLTECRIEEVVDAFAAGDVVSY